MPAPREIIDGLESILDVFTSNIRHRERVIFILCDNLVELACKTKAYQRDHTFYRHCGFYPAWNAEGVKLAPNGLGGRVHGRRTTRNTMQHGSAAVTVTLEHCADAILDCSRVVNRLWQKTTNKNLTTAYQVVLRVVALYSSSGDAASRQPFEDAMRQGQWRSLSDERRARVNEVIVEAGLRRYWDHAIHQSPQLVEQILASL